MATVWAVVPNLNELRDQLNLLFPERDKASDGSIGDLAHQNESSSSHNPDETGNAEWDDPDTLNEVRARDFDKDLKDPEITCEKLVQHLVSLCRSGHITWWRYIIFNRRIWRKSTGWRTEAYTGSSPHTEHFHITSDYSQTADTIKDRDYRLDELMALSETDKTWLRDTFRSALWGFDPGPLKDDKGKLVLDANGKPQPAWPGVQDVWNGNGETVAPGTAIGAILAWTKSMSAAMPLILSNVQADDNEKAEILKAITDRAADIVTNANALALNESQRDNTAAMQAGDRQAEVLQAVDRVDENVVAKLSDPTTPDAQVAAALNQLLGSRKAAILVLMQK